MKKIISSFALGMSLLVMPAFAQAEVTPEGFYAGANLNLSLPGEYSASFLLGAKEADNFPVSAKSGVTYGGGIKFGYAFGLEGRVSPRVEFAVDYMRGKFGGEFKNNDIDKYVDAPLNNWSVMFNTLFDVNVGSKFYPYFGVGFGLDYLNTHITSTKEEVAAGYPLDIKATVYLPKFQAILGVGYNLTDSVGLFAQASADARLGADVDGWAGYQGSPDAPVYKEPFELSALMRPGFNLTAGVRVSF